MTDSALRKRIAQEAARLMFQREDKHVHRARCLAAQKISPKDIKPWLLPSQKEIESEFHQLIRQQDIAIRNRRLRWMRFQAYQMMQLLTDANPRAIGPLVEGIISDRTGIEINIDHSQYQSVIMTLKKASRSFDESIPTDKVYPQLTIHGPVKLVICFVNSIEATTELIDPENPLSRSCELHEIDSWKDFNEAENEDSEESLELPAEDPFDYYRSLLLPLELIKQSPLYHPEGDVLYHSLQVYDLTYERTEYDQELLLAALLHDVGISIDPRNIQEASLELLDDFISERTYWFIEQLDAAHAYLNGSIGARSRKRLQSHPDFDALINLARADIAGRVKGKKVTDLDQALQELKELEY